MMADTRFRRFARGFARGVGPRGWWLACLLALASACSRGDLPLADGQFASFADWAGRHVVINYWAEWCAPCRKEMPELNALHRAAGDQVVVLGVNYDGVTGAELDRLIDAFEIEFPLLLTDPGARFGQTIPSVVPTTLIIGPDGQLKTVLVGPQSLEDLARAVDLKLAPDEVQADEPQAAPAGSEQPQAGQGAQSNERTEI